MNEDFMQYVYARCEKALTENEEYMDLQRKKVEAMKSNADQLADDTADQMECRAEELCYMKGFNDAMRMILNIK